MSTTTAQNDRDPETIELYTEESLEGLQRVEDLLVCAERGDAPKDMLGTLFRTVHTIKGTAGYLAYARTQELSHSAEDLLSKMRDGKIKPSSSHYSCLIDVSDRLKTLVRNVKSTNEEGDVDVASLINRLVGLTNAENRVVEESATPTVSAAESPAQTSTGVPTPVLHAGPAHSKVTSSETPVTGLATKPDLDADSKESASPIAVEPVDGTVRVNVNVLDRLMDLIGELVLARNQMVQMVKTSSDGNVSTQSVFQRLNVVTSDLQEQVMKTRMQPVARVFEKIPRIVRDVSRVTCKHVNTIVEGNATEIDKALVEAIRDPVMHIVRNAVDHGIESEAERSAASKPKVGSLFIRAAHKGGAVTIEVEDDGRGMDPTVLKDHAVKKGIISQAEASKLSPREALDLVFRPGFSTARQVSDISGRGVGMDVVRTHVERAGGKAEIESTPGRGTIIRLKMPLTMAIIPALLVRAKHQRFAIPQANLLELVYLTEEQRQNCIETVRGAAIHKLRGEFIPVVDLSQTLGLVSDNDALRQSDTNIVILSSGARRYSLIVDAIENTEEIVLKPLRGQLKRISCYSGATVLGDGGVALILDVPGMATKSGIDLTKDYKQETSLTQPQDIDTELVMIFRIGENTQCAVPLAMVARLEQVDVEKIEVVGKAEFFQYRKRVVPIVRPEKALSDEPIGGVKDSQLLIIFDFGTPIAMAVEQVIDVGRVPQPVGSCEQKGQCVYGKTVIYGKTTLFLDIYNLVRQLEPNFGERLKLPPREYRVITLLQAPAMRSSLETALQRSGIRISTCSTLELFLRELKKQDTSHSTALVIDVPDDTTSARTPWATIQAQAPSCPILAWGGQTDVESGVASEASHLTIFRPSQREELLQCIFGLSNQIVVRTGQANLV